MRFTAIIISSKKCFFWFFDVRFWSCTLLSVISPFIISGAWSYPLFVFNYEILHAARLKLPIRSQELSNCSCRSISIKRDSFDVLTESHLLIKAKLVIKQFVIYCSQFRFFISTCIFPCVYLCLQLFYAILCLKYQQPQALTELAIGLRLRDIWAFCIIILIFKGRAIHQFLSYSFCRDWLSS